MAGLSGECLDLGEHGVGCIGEEPRQWNSTKSQLVRAVLTVLNFEALVEKLEIARDIAAHPDVVYAAISDVTRMGEWSEECYSCEWHTGFDRAVVGATFDGHNRNGDNEWTSQGKIIEADPGRSFAFECSMFDFHFSTWGYRIEPSETGCRVIEWSEDLRPESALEFSRKMSGVADRAQRNRQTITGTLGRLAFAVED